MQSGFIVIVLQTLLKWCAALLQNLKFCCCVDEGIWSVVVLMPHRASLFGEFWEQEWAPANGENTTFAFSSPKCCFSIATKHHHHPLKNTPMQAHESKISHLHASALLDKHWPSTLHWVREWRFTSAWLNLNWNWRKRNQNRGNQAWWAEQVRERVSKVGMCNDKWQSMKPQSRGLGWTDSTVGCQPQQLPYRCSPAGSEMSHLQIWP